MKKILVGIIVVLMVGILVFHYLDRAKKEGSLQIAADSSTSVPRGVPSSDVMGGIPLPDHDYVRLSSDALVSLPNQFAECAKNVKDITADYGFFWGDVEKVNYKIVPFSIEDNWTIQELYVNYYACKALAANSPEICKGLPGKGSNSPANKCKLTYTLFSFFEFMSGKKNDVSSCRNFLAEDFIDRKYVNDETLFCDTAKGGMSLICGEPKIANSAVASRYCKITFPKNKGDCKKIDVPEKKDICLANLGIYEAIKKSDSSSCPTVYREICEAVVKGKEGPCETIKEKLVGKYCEMYVKAQKKSLENRVNAVGNGKIAGKIGFDK